MCAVKTIDVKGLGHTEKEGLILPGVEALDVNETARIVIEFNPVPLVYMLKTKGGFDVTYEKEGPKEWILRVTRTGSGADKKAQIKELLKELKGEQITKEAQEKARALLQTVDATTLGVLEQELIKEGISHDEIRKSLCDIHLEVMRDSLVAKRIEVSAPHPVHTLMEEHKVILHGLTELSSLIEGLKAINSFEAMGQDMEKLKDIAHHLVEAESHHQREEETVFPQLKKHDITEPPDIMMLEHVEFRKRKQELYQLAYNDKGQDFSGFKRKVIELGEYLAKELDSHIFKEDNILYQIALQVLGKEEWDQIKKDCDKIGYCCYSPEGQSKGEVELDLRKIMPFERHELIFQKWDALKQGETLKIINDHNPKPLYYQFDAEYKNHYKWDYVLEGPKDWVVTIKKI